MKKITLANVQMEEAYSALQKLASSEQGDEYLPRIPAIIDALMGVPLEEIEKGIAERRTLRQPGAPLQPERTIQLSDKELEVFISEPVDALYAIHAFCLELEIHEDCTEPRASIGFLINLAYQNLQPGEFQQFLKNDWTHDDMNRLHKAFQPLRTLVLIGKSSEARETELLGEAVSIVQLSTLLLTRAEEGLDVMIGRFNPDWTGLPKGIPGKDGPGGEKGGARS